MSRPPASIFNCLIRTHHITSRKKLHKVKKAASQLGVHWLLIRSGGSPGLMYAESPAVESLEQWVGAVQALRYKDFQCPRKPAPLLSTSNATSATVSSAAALVKEVTLMSDFAHEMETRGLTTWWHKAMGYE